MPENIRKKYLTTHQKARKYLNSLLNQFRSEEDPDVQRYRAEVYLLKTLLDYFRLESDLEIEEKMKEIERKLEDLQKCEIGNN